MIFVTCILLCAHLQLFYFLFFSVALGYRQGPNAPSDSFLGMLSLAEGLRVYGLVSNTKTRFLIAIKDALVREEEVRAVGSNLIFKLC